ncbi:2-amino-4-hydroxy-6-hydroxymethyldihydropteridinepyrophosphokinase [Rhodococcus sp. RD6.2]|jgi:2-amino-4-hydroxy-6-hydroxymethyldihydropteridine diphosphokinase|uniref:2-amino-4-hydroxy-6- hydroxymethyldihydropteridine diphosphokinase n=1 Tax=Rhodococcus sp. RD6.2 TaxID=260936 RepID=UPI00063B3DCF|nr:2-amino-4-hydroxy-6-hydroxymethyldihydropteridine diphosphokinase [Rhodococcus sp. RD6.2]CRK50205.1 2-amino-4-hydroxy-6-hydroxymethyldihydropteridinepyrophosphokinase [Rhodococcus sp. RD6.2]
MARVVLSIGSNLGDPLANLRSVVDELGPRLVAVSSVYATAPWGGVDQQDFLNATLIADDDELDCRGWLRFGQDLEQRADRVRDVRWGPRSLDVDVIDCGGVVSVDPELTLPHPRAHLRAFVLVPWLEIDPDAVLTVDGSAVGVAELARSLDPADVAGVRRTDMVLAVS